jgi:hypothetical protein
VSPKAPAPEHKTQNIIFLPNGEIAGQVDEDVENLTLYTWETTAVPSILKITTNEGILVGEKTDKVSTYVAGYMLAYLDKSGRLTLLSGTPFFRESQVEGFAQLLTKGYTLENILDMKSVISFVFEKQISASVTKPKEPVKKIAKKTLIKPNDPIIGLWRYTTHDEKDRLRNWNIHFSADGSFVDVGVIGERRRGGGTLAKSATWEPSAARNAYVIKKTDESYQTEVFYLAVIDEDKNLIVSTENFSEPQLKAAMQILSEGHSVNEALKLNAVPYGYTFTKAPKPSAAKPQSKAKN